MVCPMRVVLVVVSAFVAGYLSWKTYQGTAVLLAQSTPLPTSPDAGKKTSVWGRFFAYMKALVTVLFDMATGRYLYKVWLIRDQEDEEDSKFFPSRAENAKGGDKKACSVAKGC